MIKIENNLTGWKHTIYKTISLHGIFGLLGYKKWILHGNKLIISGKKGLLKTKDSSENFEVEYHLNSKRISVSYTNSIYW